MGVLAMPITVTPLDDKLSFGCRINGVTDATLKDETIRQQIRDAFEDRGLIVFEGMEPSNQMQAELSKVFGPLKDHPVTAVDKPDQENLGGAIRVITDPADCDIVEIDGTAYSNWLPWHFDHCYNNELNRAGVLRVLEISQNGGQTCFMDGVALYQALAPELRAKADELSVIYSLDMQPDHIRFGRPDNFHVLQVNPVQLQMLEQHKVYPRAIHPAVWTRASGEKVPHVSPWMSEGIEGHEDADGAALLSELANEVNRLSDEGAYVHHWKPSDMIIWDNWRMLHRVIGCTPPQRRVMQRTTIKGDYGLGRFENDDQGRYRELERTV
jgi:taurine dioxygenase